VSKVVKLTQRELRALVVEASKKAKRPPPSKKTGVVKAPPQRKPVDKTAHEVSLFLEKHASYLDHSDAEEALDASRGLEQVRRIFQDSKWEAKITEMIVLCDEVADFANVNMGSGDPGDDDSIGGGFPAVGGRWDAPKKR
jgi:hypothetical protein